MAAKRKNPPPPPPQPDSSDDDSSSSEDEEQYVAQPVATQPKIPKPTEQDDDESESDSGTESDTEPPVVVPPPQKPSESEDSSGEEEEDEEEQEEAEKLKSPVKAPETEPDKKKLKLEPDQSGSKKSASANSRIWSQDDEIVLLRALSEYHSKNGKLPPTKDYGSLLSSISGSISFPATEKQLTNKMRLLKDNFGQKKKKGTAVKFTKPHDKAVFEMCSKLFQDDIKTPKKEVLPESNSDDTEIAGLTGVGEANGAMANRSPANNDLGNDAAGTRSFIHLRSLLKDMQCERLLTIKDVIACIGESRAQSLEEKTKMLNIDAIKLRARKEKVKAEVLGYLAEGLADE